MEHDIRRYFEVARDVTLEAGKIIETKSLVDKVVESKDVEWDLVTNYDQFVEKFLTTKILEHFPDHKFIGEESYAKSKRMPELTNSPTWIIDPIDGTLNFVHDLPEFAISVGLVVNKEVVVGVIYNPIRCELYTAQKGEGAFFNGKQIHTSNCKELKKALMLIPVDCMKVDSKRKDLLIARMVAFTEMSQGVRDIGSAALAMAYVARGILDCYEADCLSPWDIAAGVVILLEAGGTLLNSKGGPFDVMNPQLVAASTAELAHEITSLIVDVDLKTRRKRLQKLSMIADT